MSGISKVSLSYHMAGIYSIIRSLFCTGALVARVAKLRRNYLKFGDGHCHFRHRGLRRIAKQGKCSGTVAHLSNSDNKNQAKILIAATYLGLCANIGIGRY